jgi:hypothetical protein
MPMHVLPEAIDVAPYMMSRQLVVESTKMSRAEMANVSPPASGEARVEWSKVEPARTEVEVKNFIFVSCLDSLKGLLFCGCFGAMSGDECSSAAVEWETFDFTDRGRGNHVHCQMSMATWPCDPDSSHRMSTTT